MYRLKKVGKKERKFLGVCGGLSKYIDPELDPVIIRLLWVIFTLFSPFMILVYFAMGLVLKKEDEILKS